MLRFLKYSVLSLAVSGLMTLSSYAQSGSGNNYSHHTGSAASTTKASKTSMLNNAQSTPCSYAYSQAYGDCESNVKANTRLFPRLYVAVEEPGGAKAEK